MYVFCFWRKWTRSESNLRRDKHDRFEDNDLAELLFDAIEEKAGCPGGKTVPDWAREAEILKLRQARQAKVCTLNEFRQYLGLRRAFTSALMSARLNVPYSTPVIRRMESGVSQCSTWYICWYQQTWIIRKIELLSYGSHTNISKPGLLCEGSNGHGFGFGYTMVWWKTNNSYILIDALHSQTWGLMADIVSDH